MIAETEKSEFIERVLESLENNPASSASFTVRFEGGGGFRGVLLPWNSLPRPEADTRKLLAPVLSAPSEVSGLSFELESETPGNWLVLFHDDQERPTEANVWEYHEEKTETEAHASATSDRRHLNYGRKGYSLLRVRTLPSPYLRKP